MNLPFRKKEKLYKQARFVFIMVETKVLPKPEEAKPESGEEALKKKAEELEEEGK